MAASSEAVAELAAYIQLYAGGSTGGVQTFFELPRRVHHHFRAEDSVAAAVFALEAAPPRKNMYLRANVQAPFGTTSETVAVWTVVTLDFDLSGGGHKRQDLPSSGDDLTRLLDDAGVPEPTVLLNTGGGRLAVWALEQAFAINSEEDRARAAILSERFQGRLAQVARSKGYHLDKTSDLVRACRLPGTRNWKPEYGTDGAPVTIVSWSARKISMTEVESVAADWAEPPKPERQTRRRKPIEAMDGGERANCDWESISAGCPALRRWAEIAEGLSEPQWYALAGVTGRCAGGRALFHELSKDDPRYTCEETDKKLDHALEASPPRTCEGIEAQGGECAGCTFRGRINSPIALGYEPEPVVVELASQFVYVTDANGFLDLNDLSGGSE